MPLNGKQRRQLRALGHHLDVVVQVGANGVTEGVAKALSQALADHELVKVKIAGEDRESRMASVDALAQQTGSEVAQTLGKTVLFFKQRKKKPKIKLAE